MKNFTTSSVYSDGPLIKALFLALFIHIFILAHLDIGISELSSSYQQFEIQLTSFESVPDVAATEIEKKLSNTQSSIPPNSSFGDDSQKIEIVQDQLFSIEPPPVSKKFYGKAAEAASFDKALYDMRALNKGSSLNPALNYYVDGILRKMQRVGNLNYPVEARRKNLYGDLKFLVVLKRDGSLKDARIIESSGHPVLDAATLSIIKKASPYPPFPPELQTQKNTLEIIKTWEFKRS